MGSVSDNVARLAVWKRRIGGIGAHNDTYEPVDCGGETVQNEPAAVHFEPVLCLSNVSNRELVGVRLEKDEFVPWRVDLHQTPPSSNLTIYFI